MYRRIGLAIVAAGLGVGQEDGRFTSRDLSDMFYTDTLPAKKKPAPPGKKGVTKTSAPQTAPGGERRRVGLKCRLLLFSGDNLREVDPGREFRSGERIRLQIESNIDGYLYVLQKGSSGAETVLFPHPDINGGSNRIERGISYAIPPVGWFAFDPTPGEERVRVVVAREPLEPAAPQARPARATETLMAAVTGLERRINTRDLVFVKEKAPAVSNTPPATQATLWINTSEERNDAVYADIVLKHR